MQVAEMWGLRDRVSSKMTPSFLAAGEGEMAASPVVIEWVHGAGMF